MLEWLFPRREIKELRDEVKRLRASYANRVLMLERENQQQRMLITLLRDVNKSLDERCNAMECDR